MYTCSYAVCKWHKASTATFPHLDWLKSSEPPKSQHRRLLDCRTKSLVLIVYQVYVWDSLLMVQKEYEAVSHAIPLSNMLI